MTLYIELLELNKDKDNFFKNLKTISYKLLLFFLYVK